MLFFLKQATILCARAYAHKLIGLCCSLSIIPIVLLHLQSFVLSFSQSVSQSLSLSLSNFQIRPSFDHKSYVIYLILFILLTNLPVPSLLQRTSPSLFQQNQTHFLNVCHHFLVLTLLFSQTSILLSQSIQYFQCMQYQKTLKIHKS